MSETPLDKAKAKEAEANAALALVQSAYGERDMELLEQTIALESLEVMRRQHEVEEVYFDRMNNQALDYRNNHIVISGAISEPSVSIISEGIRRNVRIYPDRKNMVVELNTPGGEVIAGLALFDELQRLRSDGWHITTRVRGQAASMGIVLLQAGDVREIGANSFIMFHRAAFGALGKAFEVEDSLECTKMFEGRLIKILANRSKIGEEYFYDLFEKRKDEWYDPEKAVEIGLADRIG